MSIRFFLILAIVFALILCNAQEQNTKQNNGTKIHQKDFDDRNDDDNDILPKTTTAGKTEPPPTLKLEDVVVPKIAVEEPEVPKNKDNIIASYAMPLPDDTGGITLKANAWNNSKVPILTGKWAKDGGDALNQQFPSIDSFGYSYTNDSIRWLASVIKPEYIPKGLEYHLLPLVKGNIPDFEIPLMKNGRTRDGFIVRYEIGNYLFQVADSIYDLQITVRNLKQIKPLLTMKEKQTEAIDICKMLLKKELMTYPDGTWRKYRVTTSPEYISGHFNWTTDDKNTNLNMGKGIRYNIPFDSVTEWCSDGYTTNLKFIRSFPFMSRLIFDWPEHLKTRYNSNSFYKELRTENSDNIDSNNYSPYSLGMNTKPYIPHELGGIEIKPSAWNNGTIPIVTGAWEKAGADKLNNFPVIDPNGYNYTADSVKWLAFVMKNEYIPKGIECRLLPMAKGKIPNIFSTDPADELPRDGFVVRYQIGNYLFQITDSLYDLQIAVRDLNQKKVDLTAEEKKAFGIKVVQMLVNDSLLKLPDGSLRKQKIIPRTNYISGILNWMIEHNNVINVENGQFSTSKPYDCFVNWYSDGNTTVIKLDKVYNLARDIRTLPAKYQSRFSSIALFHNDVLK